MIPGANQLLGLRNAYREGARVALLAVGGSLAAFTLMVVLVSTGLGTLLVRSERLFTAIKWAGVAYLLYLGVQSGMAGPRWCDDVRWPPGARRVGAGS